MDELGICLLILAIILAAGLFDWLKRLYKQHKAQQKTKASQAVDGTDWLTYDSTGDIKGHRKMVRRELYNDMERRKRA